MQNVISFNINNNLVRFRFVNDLASSTALGLVINSSPKSQNFALGYAGFNSITQTLSTARSGALPTIPLYPTFIGGLTDYDFFHDAPIYQGMSGGQFFMSLLG